MVLFALPLLVAPVQAPIVVTPSSAGPFPLQTAIDAAPEGATLLIEPGVYFDTQLSAKSLTLIGIGNSPDQVVLSALSFQFGSGPGLSITDLTAGQSVDISNLTITSPQFGAFALSDNAGTVVLSDSRVLGRTAELFTAAGVSIRNSSSVWFDEVHIGQEVFGPVFGGIEPTLEVEDSTVVLNSSVVEGLGSSGTVVHDGGVALSASSSSLALYDTRLIGGDAESASGPFEPASASEGGAALELFDSDVRWGGGPANEVRGGDGFADPGGGVGPGASAVTLDGGSGFVSDSGAVLIPGVESSGAVTAPAIDSGSGSTSVTPALIPRMGSSQAPALPGDAVSAVLSGEPGAALLPLFQLGQSPTVSVPGFEGLVLLDPLQAKLLPLQMLDGLGSGLLSGSLPANPGLAGLRLVIQGVQVAPLGPPQISAPTGLVIQF